MKPNPLRTLARLYGVDTTYADVWGNSRRTSDESIVRALELLGAPLSRADEAADAVRSRRQELWRESIEPVLVAWDGKLRAVSVRLPETLDAERYRVRIDLEDGGSLEFDGRVSDLPTRSQSAVAKVRYVHRAWSLPAVLPHGYHRLQLSAGERHAESLVLAAPTRAFPGKEARNRASNGVPAQQPDAGCTVKTPDPFTGLWGVFLPLYALHRASSEGAGDFADLEALMDWTAARGGNLVATLPLLTTLWEQTDDPSPYNPASRLFWNEFYLDPRRIVGFDNRDGSLCPDPTTPALTTPEAGWVDYAQEMARKRRTLETLTAAFFSTDCPRREALVEYCRQHPELEQFARFRAVGERQGNSWPHWPAPLRNGTVTAADYDESVFRYHLFTQWQVEQQLEALTRHAQQQNLLWYLDFPLGVAGAGYDVWREPELFVREASGGAPPDSFFTKGQDWGFPPLNPNRLRRQGYRYFIRALRNHLRHARVLRIDHVMGLYRLYWIPHGFPATDGVYVRYPIDELCAILTLESHRFGARIVGENLGTVPPAVDEALLRHGFDDMYVLQYETNPEKGPTLRRPPQTSVASLNTHDMPQFAAYWQGLDIDDRVDLGLFTHDEAATEHARRAELRAQLLAFLQAEHLLGTDAADPLEVLEACQAYLAQSSARVVLVNLEDLWGETEPQNRPGTYRERPNWRRKARYALEEFGDIPTIDRILATVHRLRQGAAAEPKQ